MKKNLRTIIIVFLILQGVPFAQQMRNPPDQLPRLSYCDLIREPLTYDKKEVRVRAIYLDGFEASIFFDPECATKGTWVEFDPTAETATDKKVWKKFSRLADASPERTRGGGINYPERRVEIVAVGRFDGVRPTKKIGNITFNLGFGHENYYDYQFTVERIDEVKALPESKH